MSCFSISDPKILFIHIPKNGGTSLQTAFKEVFKKKYHHKQIRNLGVKRRYSMNAHQSGILTMKEIPLRYWNEYYRFSIVRNPWDRLVSIWRFIMIDDRVFKDAYGLKNNISAFEKMFNDENKKTFKEWVLSYDHPCFFKGADLKCNRRPITKVQQSDWIIKDGKSIVDKTFRLENLDKLVSEFRKRFGADLKIPRMNTTKRGSYHEYYDSELADIVAEWYKDDIRIWGYEF